MVSPTHLSVHSECVDLIRGQWGPGHEVSYFRASADPTGTCAWKTTDSALTGPMPSKKHFGQTTEGYIIEYALGLPVTLCIEEIFNLNQLKRKIVSDSVSLNLDLQLHVLQLNHS